MTWLDLLCGLLLALMAVGGYAQGFIRGVLRLVALAAGGLLGIVFMLSLDAPATARATAGWAIAAALLGLALAALLAWSVARVVPRFVHEMQANRLLGALPALLIGLLIVALLLSVAERVAVTPETQAFIRDGTITGPLVGAVDLVEQVVAGVR